MPSCSTGGCYNTDLQRNYGLVHPWESIPRCRTYIYLSFPESTTQRCKFRCYSLESHSNQYCARTHSRATTASPNQHALFVASQYCSRYRSLATLYSSVSSGLFPSNSKQLVRYVREHRNPSCWNHCFSCRCVTRLPRDQCSSLHVIRCCNPRC